LAQHQLQHPDESRRALEEALQLINRLQADDNNKGHHDRQIAQTLSLGGPDYWRQKLTESSAAK